MMYKMQWQGQVSCIPWEWNFDIASDVMAIDYAKRCTLDSRGFRAEGMAMLLWRMSDQKLLARFVLNDPTVRNTEER